MSRFGTFVTVATLALGIAGQSNAATTVVQYGFDYTSGTVSSNGATVINDASPGTFNAGIKHGHGGTYSSDLPTNTQFTTGIGSLNTNGGAIRTGTGAFSGEAVVLYNDIAAAGGLTLETWVKGGNNGIILTVAGAYVISGTDTGYKAVNGFTGAVDFVAGVADRTQWNHVAAVFKNPDIIDADKMNVDMELYINGVLIGSDNSDLVFDLQRGLGVGDHPTLAGTSEAFTGLIYEPRISLGVVDAADFTIVPIPEPASLALLGLGGALMLRRRRN